jgi:hypothetical protein
MANQVEKTGKVEAGFGREKNLNLLTGKTTEAWVRKKIRPAVVVLCKGRP